MLTFFTATLAALCVPLARAAGGSLMLVTAPVGVTQCVPYTIEWSGGTPPYSVTVHDPVAGDIYAFWAFATDHSQVWTVDSIPKAQCPLPFVISVTDSTGINALSSSSSVQVGPMQLDSSGLCTTNKLTAAEPDNTSASVPANTSQESKPATSSRDSASLPSGASKSSGSAGASAATNSGEGVPTTKKISSGTIAGAVIGGIVLISFLGAVIAFLHRRHQKHILADLKLSEHHLALAGAKPAASATSLNTCRKAAAGLPPPDSRPQAEHYHDALSPQPYPPAAGYYDHPPARHASPYHDAPSPQAYPPTGYYDHPPPPPPVNQTYSPYHDARPLPAEPPASAPQTDIEHQISVLQRQVDSLDRSRDAARAQELQSQLTAMKVEAARIRMHGYRQ
ncbi:hypothetical protein C8J57DRAFT_1287828 [Mycena rebaudengoi]|nr:hypothetical protein C8J57DRAFT_1287828 [Mycena rebaudengoi]